MLEEKKQKKCMFPDAHHKNCCCNVVGTPNEEKKKCEGCKRGFLLRNGTHTSISTGEKMPCTDLTTPKEDWKDAAQKELAEIAKKVFKINSVPPAMREAFAVFILRVSEREEHLLSSYKQELAEKVDTLPTYVLKGSESCDGLVKSSVLALLRSDNT